MSGVVEGAAPWPRLTGGRRARTPVSMATRRAGRTTPTPFVDTSLCAEALFPQVPLGPLSPQAAWRSPYPAVRDRGPPVRKGRRVRRDRPVAAGHQGSRGTPLLPTKPCSRSWTRVGPRTTWCPGAHGRVRGRPVCAPGRWPGGWRGVRPRAEAWIRGAGIGQGPARRGDGRRLRCAHHGGPETAGLLRSPRARCPDHRRRPGGAPGRRHRRTRWARTIGPGHA